MEKIPKIKKNCVFSPFIIIIIIIILVKSWNFTSKKFL
jgi:hypothetical protein